MLNQFVTGSAKSEREQGRTGFHHIWRVDGESLVGVHGHKNDTRVSVDLFLRVAELNVVKHWWRGRAGEKERRVQGLESNVRLQAVQGSPAGSCKCESRVKSSIPSSIGGFRSGGRSAYLVFSRSPSEAS